MSLRTPRAGIIGQGAVAVAVTATAIGAGECGAVVVKADADNADVVYVGNGDVTTATGYPLAAGESVSLFVASVGAVYVIAIDTNQGARFLALSRE